MEFETEAAQAAALSSIMVSKGNRNVRGAGQLRNGNWWTDSYQNWDGDRMKPNPTTPAAKGKGKVTLFNVSTSFSYEAGINGS